MAKVVSYKYSDIGKIGTIVENDKIWFVAEDIGKILGFESIRNSIRYYIKKVGGNSKKERVNSSDGLVEVTLIDKRILYDILTHSEKPPVKNLKIWVDSLLSNQKPKQNAGSEQIAGSAKMIVFEHEKFGKIRAVVEDNEVWLAGRDVGKALGCLNPRNIIIKSVAEENKRKRRLGYSRGYSRNTCEATVINKEGLHQFLSKSQRPNAGELEQWLLSQINNQVNENKNEEEKQDANILPVQGEQSELVGKLRVFENPEFGKVRVMEQGGEPWFVAKDVALVLGYSNHRDAIARHVDDEDRKNGVVIHDSMGREQQVTIINESGLYSLILSSKLPSAKKFKRWVTSEILPAIRKHGAYLTPEVAEEVLLNPDTIIKIATQLKEEREKRIMLEAENKEFKPKVEKYEQLLDADGYIPIGKFAKAIGYGPIKLFKKLREIGFLTLNNLPHQEHVDGKRAVVKERTIVIGDSKKIYFQTLLTPKGQDYLLEKLGIVKGTEVITHKDSLQSEQKLSSQRQNCNTISYI